MAFRSWHPRCPSFGMDLRRLPRHAAYIGTNHYFVTINVRINAQLTPRVTDVDDLVAKAERDCFIGASLTLKPEYEWHV